MSNRNELRRARMKAQEAAASLEAIESLPRRRGAMVRWRNDVIWERIGDDHWETTAAPGFRYSSEHVASLACFPVVSPVGGENK